jgi:hypothetical protein
VGARIADSQGIATIVNDDRPLAPLEPKPKVHKSVVAAPSSGTVQVKVAGSDKFVELTGGQEIPLGTVVDTKHGRVTIVAASTPREAPQPRTSTTGSSSSARSRARSRSPSSRSSRS